MSKKLLATLIAGTFSCGLALAQNTPNVIDSPTASPAPLSQEAKDAKVQSKADYKARKKVADANKELSQADCETSADGAVERACKKEAKAAAKQDKAHAKTVYETEKKQIQEKDQATGK
ncbi:hypothetical protein ACVNIS_20715 [Sphaerotilaceae bacterium SBD11-9]